MVKIIRKTFIYYGYLEGEHITKDIIINNNKEGLSKSYNLLICLTNYIKGEKNGFSLTYRYNKLESIERHYNNINVGKHIVYYNNRKFQTIQKFNNLGEQIYYIAYSNKGNIQIINFTVDKEDLLSIRYNETKKIQEISFKYKGKLDETEPFYEYFKDTNRKSIHYSLKYKETYTREFIEYDRKGNIECLKIYQNGKLIKLLHILLIKLKI